MASGPIGIDIFESSIDMGTLAVTRTAAPGPQMSIASSVPTTWPIPSNSAVFAFAEEFLIKWEVAPKQRYKDAAPYVIYDKDGNADKNSGVTCGIGYDLGQRTEKEIRSDFHSLPKDDLDSLVKAAGHTGGSQTTAEDVFDEEDLDEVVIPWKVQLEAFRESSLTEHYKISLKAFPGMAMLPLGTQVALVSVVFNRGGSMWDGGNKKHKETMDGRWEFRRLAEAAASRNILGIANLLRSMERLWKGKGGVKEGLRNRREAEVKLAMADYYLFVKPHETRCSSSYFRFLQP